MEFTIDCDELMKLEAIDWVELLEDWIDGFPWEARLDYEF